MDDEAARIARALARASWPVTRTTLVNEREPDLSQLSPGERVAMVWQVTLDAWASRGEAIPTYTRDKTPGRIIRRR